MTSLRGLLLALAALVIFVFGASDAAAHASLLAATPADGAALQRVPAQVELEFDEPVSPLSMRLVGSRGVPLDLSSAASTLGSRVRVALPAIDDGAYVFSWRVVSADAHPVAGSIAFSVGTVQPSSRPAATAGAGPDAGLDVQTLVARFVRDLLLLTASGAALYALLIGGFPGHRVVLTVAGAGAVIATVVDLGAHGAQLVGDDASLLAALRVAAATSAGSSAVCIAAGMALVVIGAWMTHRAARTAMLLVGGIGAAAGVAFTGHAAAAQPPQVAIALVAGHAVMAAFWIGSLLALRLAMRADAGSLVRGLRRFSRLAMPAVAVLAVAGITFAAMQIDRLGDLTALPYGRLVLAKAILLVALLAIAACNRFVLTARLAAGDPRARVWLRRAVSSELALVALVLAVTAVLGHTPPHARAAVTQSLVGSGAYGGSVTVSPARPGRNRIVVTLVDGTGRPLAVDDAKLVLTHPGSSIESIERKLVRDGAGRFHHDGSEMSFPGTWQLEVDMRIGDYDRYRLSAEVEVRVAS